MARLAGNKYPPMMHVTANRLLVRGQPAFHGSGAAGYVDNPAGAFWQIRPGTNDTSVRVQSV